MNALFENKAFSQLYDEFHIVILPNVRFNFFPSFNKNEWISQLKNRASLHALFFLIRLLIVIIVICNIRVRKSLMNLTAYIPISLPISYARRV